MRIKQNICDVKVVNDIKVVNGAKVVNGINVVNGVIYAIRHAPAANHVKVILQDEGSTKVINYLIYRPIT